MTTDEEAVVSLLIDPSTNLVRRVSVDMRKTPASRAAGREAAQFTIDYTAARPNAAVTSEQFAWAPPEGSKDATQLAQEPPSDPKGLEGKARAGLHAGRGGRQGGEAGGPEGERRRARLLGDVVPAVPRRALPHLDKLSEETKDAGVRVFAVNVEEDKAVIEKFIAESKLKSTVLIDSAGTTSAAYGTELGMPITAVIGKDGVVKKVMSGFNPDKSPQELADAVKAAQAE